MKKKNGFTLIELLAVIVILAIIALIAVPQILKILNKARLNAAKDSTYGIIKAAETYATNFMLENNGSLPKEDLVFNCSSYGCILENNLENYNTTNLDKLSFKGTKPTSGKITISNDGKTIKAEDLIINDFRCNYDKEVICGDIDASEIPAPPTVLITPTAEPRPSGYSQSKTVTVNYIGDGTYLVMPTIEVTTNVEAITCRDVEDAEYTCDGETININGTLIADTWYKVESNPTLTLEENGSIYYKVTDGTNYKDGGSLTITEIDRTAPTVASVTQRSATTNSITVTASGTDNESNIVRYQFSIDNGEWEPSEPQEDNEYTFNNVTSGNHSIKVRVINGTFVNDGQNTLNTTESSSVTMAPGELTKPEATSSPSGYSQSKTVTIDYKSSPGTYLLKPNVNVTTNVVATTCSNVDAGAYTCNGTNVSAGGTLQKDTWYKVESNPTLTLEENGSIYYKVTDGTNYKDGGSLTITEIDRTAPTVASVSKKSTTTNSITVTASGTDNDSNIAAYQFSIDNGEWLPSTPQTNNEYTFNGVTSGQHQVRVKVINETFVNNGQNELNTTESAQYPIVCNFSKNYDYTGKVQTFVSPGPGTYKIELWGAQGGTQGINSVGGKGAYTQGQIYLNAGEILYVYVGESPGSEIKSTFGGGSMGTNSIDTGGNPIGTMAGSGGGATDIRLEDGAWDSFDSLKTRIMVAAGGGGNSNYGLAADGGYGGALIGGDGSKSQWSDWVPLEWIESVPTGGTQVAGGLSGKHTDLEYMDYSQYIEPTNGYFGKAGNSIYHLPTNSFVSGSGSGYYGGGGGTTSNSIITSGAGGSSFISGYDGCDAIDRDSTEMNIIHTGQSIHYSGKYFEYPNMIAGNSSMPTHDGNSTMIGNTGNGYAKITYIK